MPWDALTEDIVFSESTESRVFSLPPNESGLGRFHPLVLTWISPTVVLQHLQNLVLAEKTYHETLATAPRSFVSVN